MLAYRVESAVDLALSIGRLAATGLVQPQSAWSRSLTAARIDLLTAPLGPRLCASLAKRALARTTAPERSTVAIAIGV